MFWSANEIEITDPDNRKRSPRLVVAHNYYLIALLRRLGLNDRQGAISMAWFFLIQCRPTNFAVETERDEVFSWSEIPSVAQDAIG
jgi:hypothetical protein